MLSTVDLEEFTSRNEIQLVKSGTTYFDLLEELIGKARHTIHLQTYIFSEDETGTRIGNALILAAQRDVQVYLIVDGYASQDLSKQFINRLSEAGIHFRWFAAFFRSKYFYLGRRLHHKVLVVDGEQGLVGGINISDHYNDTTVATAWLDYAVHVQGEAVAKLKAVCERRTEMFKSVMNRSDSLLFQEKKIKVENKCLVRVRVNDWVRLKKEITMGYLQMLQQARSSVIIMSPYFIPGSKFLQELIDAAKRGVHIQLILAGVSDVLLAKYAERYIYRRLFNKNIQIYEYQKKILHGKIAVCDKEWVTVGSYNINNISAYASVELNLEIKDSNFAVKAGDELSQIIREDCDLITEAYYEANIGFLKRLMHRGAYDVFRFLFFLFTFYFKQHKE